MSRDQSGKGQSGAGIFILMLLMFAMGWGIGSSVAKKDGMNAGVKLAAWCERNMEEEGYVSVAECFEDVVSEIRAEDNAEAAAMKYP